MFRVSLVHRIFPIRSVVNVHRSGQFVRALLLLMVAVALFATRQSVTDAAPLQQGISNRCYAIADESGRLVPIQRSPAQVLTGGILVLNPASSDRLEGLAFDLTSTILYSAYQNDPNDSGVNPNSTFATLDPVAGTRTNVGTTLDIGTAPGDVILSGAQGNVHSGQVTGLAVEQTNGGFTVWAVSKFVDIPGANSTVQRNIVFKIDPATGRHISNAFGAGVDYHRITGFSGTSNDNLVEDIAISPTGVVYVITHTRLYTFSPVTGAATLVGIFNPVSTQMEGLTFAADGTLYASQGDSGGENNELDIINTTTAARTKVIDLPVFGGVGDYESLTCLGEQTTDLAVTKTVNIPTYTAGGQLTYTITVRNNGPRPANGAVVADNRPAQIATWQWTCASQTGGATGCDGTGVTAANFTDTVNLPVGGQIIYSVLATLSSTATGTLVNTVSLTSPTGVVDYATTNNIATASNTKSTTAPPAAPAVQAPVTQKVAEVPEADTALLLSGGLGGFATWLGWQWRKVRRRKK